jgi:Ca2+-binding EF-hand superfamily protein
MDGNNGSYEKQLQSMVETVFKNYDSNHDGFISKEEFQTMCTNHPAIDAFFVLDENRLDDQPISLVTAGTETSFSERLEVKMNVKLYSCLC